MILLATILATTFNEFSNCEEEFDCIDENHEEFFETDSQSLDPVLWSIIAEQKNRKELLSYVVSPFNQVYKPIEKIEKLLAPIFLKGATVVDFGMGISVFLAKQVGEKGRVYVFESQLDAFKIRFWQLNYQLASQALLYYIKPKNQESIDNIPDEYVSLVCISIQGRENHVLKGLAPLIKRDHPLLLINIIGGMSVKEADLFVIREFKSRKKDIEKMGYKLICIEKDLYLGLPLNNDIQYDSSLLIYK